MNIGVTPYPYINFIRKLMMLECGDCRTLLINHSSDSIDSLITDPPAGISFMNKEWDKPTDFIKNVTAIYKECLRILKPGAHGLVWAIPRTSHWTATALEQAGFEIRDVITHLFGNGFPKSLNIGNGMGTALKPASEHWILIRKPLSESTIAKNVLTHGTGGINVDESRIELSGFVDPRYGKNIGGKETDTQFGQVKHSMYCGSNLGRFPANLVLSHNEDCEEQCTEGCAVKMLDEQSGVLKSGYIRGASRFFYCAKASRKDRGIDNTHPTVKSTKLMEYLIRLITPPQGIVLDPFMGSGSTGVAAKRLGFEFIGIEKELDYFEIARKRLETV